MKTFYEHFLEVVAYKIAKGDLTEGEGWAWAEQVKALLASLEPGHPLAAMPLGN